MAYGALAVLREVVPASAPARESPDADVAPTRAPEPVVRSAPRPAPNAGQASVRWLHSWPEGGPATYRVGRAGEEFIAEWVGIGSLYANVASGKIVFKPQGVIRSAAVHERLRAQVAALLRHRRGGVTLHASSIARQGVAISCIGESGAGKSTLAAQLCSGAGVELLADDTSALRFDGAVIEVAPTERYHWLRADAAQRMGVHSRGLSRVPAEAARPASKPARLGAFVSLVFDDRATAPVLRRIQGVEALSTLSRSTFNFAFEAAQAQRDALDHAARLAREAVVFELARPRDLARLEESSAVVAKLLDHLVRDDADG
jgi:hypothetical protein